MTKYAVIKTGGKQYLVKENDEIIVDQLPGKVNEKLEIEKLAEFEDKTEKIELGTPSLKEKTKAQIIAHLKGDKIKIAKFKAKVRYRKVKGFRPKLTKLKIINI